MMRKSDSSYEYAIAVRYDEAVATLPNPHQEIGQEPLRSSVRKINLELDNGRSVSIKVGRNKLVLTVDAGYTIIDRDAPNTIAVWMQEKRVA